MLIFIIGPSASGKGTQAELLAQHYHVPHISIGDLFRQEIHNGTEIGKQIQPIVEKGDFVPGLIAQQVLKQHLENAFVEQGGAIVDGFPRLHDQAHEIQPVVDTYKGPFRVIHYVLSYEECEKREEVRKQAGGARKDDFVLKERYDAYAVEIEAIRQYYQEQGKLIEIDARPDIDHIFHESLARLEESIANEKI